MPNTTTSISDHKPPMLRQRLWILLTVGAWILLDQSTKQIASQTLSPLISSIYLDGFLRLIYAENSGIMQSIGNDLSSPLKTVLFTLLPAISFLLLLVYVLLKRQDSRLALLAFSLLISGGLSNVLDRLMNDGLVIDFVYLVAWGRMTGIFNLADLFISVGCTLLILHMLTGRGHTRRARESGSG